MDTTKEKIDCLLLAADIDGTLLNSKSKLSFRTEQSIKKLTESGVKFVLSTGRPLQGIKKFTERLGLIDAPAILYNGAMVAMGGEVAYSLEIDRGAAARVIEEGKKRNAHIICWSKNELFANFSGEKLEFYKKVSSVTPTITDDLMPLAERGVTKFVWYDDEAATKTNHEELSIAFADKLSVYPSRVDFLEFVNKDCSKATALESLIKRLDIPREKTVAVGDGFNDLPMLKFAATGVAMGNADEKVKRECDLIIGCCDEDGLAEFIEKALL